MKKKICEYFAANPMSSYIKCAKSLEENGLTVQHLIHELVNEGYLKCAILPLGNDIEPNNSNFYSLRKVYDTD